MSTSTREYFIRRAWELLDCIQRLSAQEYYYWAGFVRSSHVSYKIVLRLEQVLNRLEQGTL